VGRENVGGPAGRHGVGLERTRMSARALGVPGPERMLSLGADVVLDDA
jgi:hypothetical protein